MFSRRGAGPAGVALFATGGTIASRRDAEKGGLVPARSAEELAAAVPGMAAVASLRTVEVSRTFSSLIHPQAIFELAPKIENALAEPSVAGGVVTHGTATLEESAFLLDLVLATPKPVVVVGAMRPADAPDPDGPRNLLDAVRVAASPAAHGLGVLVCANGEIHAAADVTKTHTTAVDTFRSGDAGILGAVADGRVTIFRRPARRPPLRPAQLAANVQLVKLGQGMDDLLVRACIAAQVDGIVVEAFGNGNMNGANAAAIRDAVAAGIPVVVVSRCPRGVVAPGYAFEGGLQAVLESGAIAGEYLSGPKARILLMVALGVTRDPARVREIFRAPAPGNRSSCPGSDVRC